MDIAINRNVEYSDLKNFLEADFSAINFLLIYEGINDWDDLIDGASILHYHENNQIDGDFKYGLSVYVKNKDPLPLIETIASRLSNHFECASICDASRVVFKDGSHYYSLLFEAGQVYLVNDATYEESGTVRKIVELAYEPPKRTSERPKDIS